MTFVQRHTVTVTTATGGGATGYTPVLNGRIAGIRYTKATAASAYASTADFTITAETSEVGLWTEANVNASKDVVPTQPTHTQAGATSADPARAPVFLANERVKILLAQGGNTKSGTFEVIVA